MRMSCNGCRVLRKGCSDDCSIRPCLQWIKSPESQANATVFLAKFYGRAGLLNLINAGPENQRPAIFQSLLYEACGRVVNPVYGSVGLLWTGNWALCQAAVEAVLRGATIVASESAGTSQEPPLLSKPYDIRHVSRDESSSAAAAAAAATATAAEQHRARTRTHRSERPSSPSNLMSSREPAARAGSRDEELNWSTSHASSLSHQSEGVGGADGDDVEEAEIKETVAEADEPAQLLSRPSRAEHQPNERASSPPAPDSEVCLELKLGMGPLSREEHVMPVKKRRLEGSGAVGRGEAAGAPRFSSAILTS